MMPEQTWFPGIRQYCCHILCAKHRVEYDSYWIRDSCGKAVCSVPNNEGYIIYGRPNGSVLSVSIDTFWKSYKWSNSIQYPVIICAVQTEVTWSVLEFLSPILGASSIKPRGIIYFKGSNAKVWLFDIPVIMFAAIKIFYATRYRRHLFSEFL